ncbi:MAG: hypothetical protein ACTMHL_00815 [Janibacter sp.]
MAEHDTTAVTPGIDQGVGFGVGAGVSGLAALGAVAALSDSPLRELVSCLVFALIFGLIMWLLSRRSEPGAISRGGLSDVGPRREFVRGLLQAVVVAASAGVFWMLYVWAFGGRDTAHVSVPGVLLGTTLWVALEIWRPGRRRDDRVGEGPPSSTT